MALIWGLTCEASVVENKALVQELRRLLDAGEFDAAGELLSEDVRWWVPRSSAELGFDRPVTGRDAVVRLTSGASERFYRPGSMTRQYHSFVAEDDLVAVWFTLRAITLQGDTYLNDYHELFRCEDGLVSEVWEHLDTAYAMSKSGR